jgi:hypothetical protein
MSVFDFDRFRVVTCTKGHRQQLGFSAMAVNKVSQLDFNLAEQTEEVDLNLTAI